MLPPTSPLHTATLPATTSMSGNTLDSVLNGSNLNTLTLNISRPTSDQSIVRNKLEHIADAVCNLHLRPIKQQKKILT